MTNRIYWVWAITSGRSLVAGGPENGMYSAARPSSQIGQTAGEAALAFAEEGEDLGGSDVVVTIAVIDPHTLERWTFVVTKTMSVMPSEVPQCPA